RRLRAASGGEAALPAGARRAHARSRSGRRAGPHRVRRVDARALDQVRYGSVALDPLALEDAAGRPRGVVRIARGGCQLSADRSRPRAGHDGDGVVSTPPAPLDFSGRTALVTGGSRGLGAAITARLAALGAHVFVNYVRDEASARRTLDAVQAGGGSATPVRANLANLAEVDAMFESVASAGPLDILVHSAALGVFKKTMDVRGNQWDLSMAVNARALLWCAQRAAPLMRGRRGRIVSISSL